MIFSVKGSLSHTFDDRVVIEAAGIGYEIWVPDSVLGQVPHIGGDITLFTHHHIREDQNVLFGFLSQEDRRFFDILTSISGVGPKLGIKILSAIQTKQFIEAILNENIATLTQIPGVGKKMAERMIVELKDKLPKIYNTDEILASVGEGSSPRKQSALGNKENDLMLALRSLGYHQEEIKRAIASANDLYTEEMSLEACIKATLRFVA